MYVGCPMSVSDGDKVTAQQQENEKALTSNDIEVLVEVAKRPELSVRQVRYLAMKCANLAPPTGDGIDVAGRLAAAIVQHPKCSSEAVRILNGSTLSVVWVVVAQSTWLDEGMAQELDARAARLRRYRGEQAPMALAIWKGLASSTVLSGKIQDYLLGTGMDDLYAPLSQSVTLSGPRLLRLAKKVRDALPKAVANEAEVLQALGTHDNSTDETLRIVQQIRQYDAWVAEAEASETSIKRLVELGKACAGITDCPLRAYRLARALVCHDKTAAEVMAEMIDSPYAFVWYLATRCEMTDNATLRKIAQRTAVKYNDAERQDLSKLCKGIACELLKHVNGSEAIVSELIKGDSGKGEFYWFVCRLAPYSRHTGVETLRALRQIVEDNFRNDVEEIMIGILGNPHLVDNSGLESLCVEMWNKYKGRSFEEWMVIPEMARCWEYDRGKKLAFSDEDIELSVD